MLSYIGSGKAGITLFPVIIPLWLRVSEGGDTKQGTWASSDVLALEGKGTC